MNMSELHQALQRLQAALPAISKNETADTGKFSYSYASLNTVNRTLLPALAELGLTWTVTGTADPRGLVGTLTHAETGESMKSWWPLPATTDPQQLGSATTYARRYLLLAIVGSAPDEDDDGAAAKAGHDKASRLRARAAAWAKAEDGNGAEVVEWLSGMGAKKVDDLSDADLDAFAEQLDVWGAP